MPNTFETYAIGAVARLTGITPHVLRVWERRYDVVEPQRTDSKRRLYSKEDIRRLSLIKMLVNNGNSISSVASLKTEQLEERSQEISSSVSEVRNLIPPQTERKIAIAGTLVSDAVREAVDSEPALTVAGEFADMAELISNLREGAVDLIVIELSTVFPETVSEIRSAIKESDAAQAVVVYQFGSSEAIAALDEANISIIRFPATSSELRDIFVTDIAAHKTPEAVTDNEDYPTFSAKTDGEIPERRYSDQELAKVARLSAIVKCECPQHLSGLLSNLSAFEKYSLECENRDDADAEMHAFLHQATAQCRAEMEDALSKLLKFEKIHLTS